MENTAFTKNSPVNIDSTPENSDVQTAQAPNNSSKLKIIVIILGVLLLLSFGTTGYFAYQNGKLRKEITKLQKELSENNKVDIQKESDHTSLINNSVELFPEINWELIKENKIFDFAVYYDNYSTATDSANAIVGNKALVGQLWGSTVGNLNHDELGQLVKSFSEYYSSEELESEGWQEFVNYEGIRLSALAADGPSGSVWGYLYIEDEELKVIIVSHETEGPWTTSENTPATLNCPCTISFEVFVSEPYPLEDIVRY